MPALPVLPDQPLHDVHDKIIEEAIEAVLSTVDLEAVLERTGRLLNRRFGETRVAINRLVEGQPGRARVVLVSDPLHPSAGLGTTFALEGSAAGRALAERRPLVLDPVDGERPRFREEPFLAGMGYGSMVSFPLLFEDQVLGNL